MVFSIINDVSQLLRNVKIVFDFIQIVIIFLNNLRIGSKLSALLVSCDFIVHLLLIFLLFELRLAFLLRQCFFLFNFF